MTARALRIDHNAADRIRAMTVQLDRMFTIVDYCWYRILFDRLILVASSAGESDA